MSPLTESRRAVEERMGTVHLRLLLVAFCATTVGACDRDEESPGTSPVTASEGDPTAKSSDAVQPAPGETGTSESGSGSQDPLVVGPGSGSIGVGGGSTDGSGSVAIIPKPECKTAVAAALNDADEAIVGSSTMSADLILST